MNRIRALRAVFLVSAATVLLVNLGLTAIPCTAAAAEDGGSGVAGQLAKWSLGQAGGLIGGIVVSQAAAELLGIDRSGGVNSKLQEINSKLDQLLAEMKALNTRLEFPGWMWLKAIPCVSAHSISLPLTFSGQSSTRMANGLPRHSMIWFRLRTTRFRRQRKIHLDAQPPRG